MGLPASALKVCASSLALAWIPSAIERSVVARVDDLEALPASSQGKVEIETLEEGREGHILETLINGAVLTVFKDAVDPAQTRAVVDAWLLPQAPQVAQQ